MPERKRKAPGEEEGGEMPPAASATKRNDKKTKKQKLEEARASARKWAAEKTKAKRETETPSEHVSKKRRIEEPESATPSKQSKKQQLMEARARAKAWAAKSKPAPKPRRSLITAEEEDDEDAEDAKEAVSAPAGKKTQEVERKPIAQKTQEQPDKDAAMTGDAEFKDAHEEIQPSGMEVDKPVVQPPQKPGHQLAQTTHDHVPIPLPKPAEKPVKTQFLPPQQASPYPLVPQQEPAQPKSQVGKASHFTKWSSPSTGLQQQQQHTPTSVSASQRKLGAATMSSPVASLAQNSWSNTPFANPSARKFTQEKTHPPKKEESEEARIQEQTMANALAFHDQARPESFVGLEDDGDAVSGPGPESAKRSRPYLSCLATFLSVAVATFVTLVVIGKLDELPLTPALGLPPCFKSTPGYLPSGQLVRTFNCSNTTKVRPCPEGGLCFKGYLHQCSNPYKSPSEAGDACVYSPEANKTLTEVEAKLVNWTIKYKCDINCCDFAHKGIGDAPVFPFSKLVEETGSFDELLIADSPLFTLTKNGNGEKVVGFSDKYVGNHLDIPLACWFALVTSTLVSLLIEYAIAIIKFCAISFFSLSMAYPAVSSVSLVALWIIRVRRIRKSNHEKLMVDVAKIRHLVDKRLIADSLEYVVLHLRDAIARDLYPTSKKDRQYIISKVWPKVVADVRLDNRVSKSHQMFRGNPREVWQWVARPTSKEVSFHSDAEN